MKTSQWFKSRRNVILLASLVVLFLVLAIFVSVTSAVVVALFFAAVLLGVDGALPLVVTLVLLPVSALMLVVNQHGAAEVLANWAYYFLAIGIILMFIDFVKSGVENSTTTPTRWK